MCPIPDDQIDRHKFVLMYADERVIDAVADLRDAQGQDWWHLVVDLGEGRYAAARFSDLTAGVKAQGETFLTQPLDRLVGSVLLPIAVIAEQDQADLDQVRQRAAETPGHAAAILSGGEFRGIVPAGGTRAPGGLFDVGLVQLAGQFAEIPEKGTLSRRRMAGKPKKSASSKE